MSQQRPPRKIAPLVVGGLVLIFLAWGIWAWANWGEPGHGVNTSPQAVMPPMGVAPGETPTAATMEPTQGALPASPDQGAADATGDASRGARSVTPSTAPQTQDTP